MVALPTVELHTVTAIYEGYLKDRENYDSVGLSVSLIGHECDRNLWMTLRWASPPEPMTGQKLRRFATGNIEETRLLDDLERAGFEVQRFVDDTEKKQFKVFGIGGHVRGMLDGKVKGLPEAPTTVHVVECKSHNDRSFKDLIKNGLQESKPNHYAQCQLYMHFENIPRALYLAVNKNSDELFAERVRYDFTYCLELLVRIEHIIGEAKAPGKIADDASKYPCIMCNHKSVCHGETFGRNTCRTCIHATPIIDHESTDATWLCERFGKTLSVTEQRNGCPAHLFLPDVVPGAQRDSGDDWIEYQLRNGSIWRDGVQKEAAE